MFGLKITKGYCKYLLDSYGEKYREPINLINKQEWKKCTFREAFDYAIRDRALKGLKITNLSEKELYKFIKYLVYYKLGFPVCKKININYFDHTNTTRYAFNLFISRLADRGFMFQSPTSEAATYFKLKKLEKYGPTISE